MVSTSEFFIAFIVEDSAMGQCLLLGECKSPKHPPSLKECERTLWELQICKVVLNSKRILGPDKSNCVVSFQSNALGQTFQIMLGMMTMSTDKYFGAILLELLKFLFADYYAEVNIFSAGIQCECTYTYKR